MFELNHSLAESATLPLTPAGRGRVASRNSKSAISKTVASLGKNDTRHYQGDGHATATIADFIRLPLWRNRLPRQIAAKY
jgi:hypothetical protein